METGILGRLKKDQATLPRGLSEIVGSTEIVSLNEARRASEVMWASQVMWSRAGRARLRHSRLVARRLRRAANPVVTQSMFSVIAVFGVVVLALGLNPSGAFADPADGPVTVLELFTSQGCASCPPADKLLGQLAERKDVVALSLPVEYWDYLGWKDTFAHPNYTDRQRHYSDGWGEQIYTPELVVNGLVGVVGSDRRQIEGAIAASLKIIGGSRVPVSIQPADDSVVVNVGAALNGAAYRSGAVWVAWLTRRMAVDVKTGENKGRRLSYHNVVRDLKRVGVWDGSPASFTVPKDLAIKEGYDVCVAMVQSEEGGPILGAAQEVVRSEEAVERN